MKQNKNIHVLPTDKPSRIYLIKSNNKLGITSNNPEFTENFGSGTQNQNIYITSDEEIKERDWFIVESRNIPMKCTGVDEYGDIGNDKNTLYYNHKYCKKIILTDNKDLIKDNVQAIDDEFLEWFVKNPSCEEVEVERNFADEGIKGITYYGKYFITIPKEESKQDTQIQQMEDRIMGKNVDTGYRLQEEPKQDFPMQGLIDKMENDKTLKGTMTEAIQRVVSSQVDSINELNVHLKAEQIQNECHKFVESVPNVTYQDATNTFIFMKLAELTKNMNENLEKIVSKEPSKFWAESDARKRNRETLEEAMEKNGYHDKPSDDLWREGVEFGAKWQQDNNKFSEEEVLSIFEEWKIFDENQDSFSGKDDLTFRQWFELKKKK
jgi:hypothetical protein